MQTYKVEGMTCGHCTRAVTEAIRAVDPGAAVEVDLATGRVGVDSTATPDVIIRAIVAEGYGAEPISG